MMSINTLYLRNVRHLLAASLEQTIRKQMMLSILM